MLSDVFRPPVHKVFQDFLDESLVGRLLDRVLSEESNFEPTRVRTVGELDLSVRKSLKLKDVGPLQNDLRKNLSPLAPELIAALGVTPFDLFHLELELVAHGDGAFYNRHIDTTTGDLALEKVSERMISAVYYFNASPKAFSGGELRLYAFASAPDREQGFVDISPDHNSLAVFPSWAAHEVRPVRCPSMRFMDSRFAINCWFRRKRPGTPTPGK